MSKHPFDVAPLVELAADLNPGCLIGHHAPRAEQRSHPCFVLSTAFLCPRFKGSVACSIARGQGLLEFHARCEHRLKKPVGECSVRCCDWASETLKKRLRATLVTLKGDGRLVDRRERSRVCIGPSRDPAPDRDAV